MTASAVVREGRNRNRTESPSGVVWALPGRRLALGADRSPTRTGRPSASAKVGTGRGATWCRRNNGEETASDRFRSCLGVPLFRTCGKTCKQNRKTLENKGFFA